MDLFKITILAFVVLFAGIGCASKPKESGYDVVADAAQTQFEQGMRQMDQSRYAEAAKVFEKILVQNPASEFDFVVLYNLGAAREGQKQCHAAAEHYRAVARGAAKRFPRLEATALLRLSYAYECLGQDNKALVALLDARKRYKDLPEDTVRAELPARIAAAYARSGNREEAEKFFKIALGGIKFLQQKYKDSLKLADTLAETLYFMGRSHVSESEFVKNPIAQIRGIELMQLYLLQSAEMASSKWSNRAVDEILANYRRIWAYSEKIKGEPDDDKTIEERRTKIQKSEVFKEAIRSVRVLKGQRIPSRNESSDIRRLFTQLDEEERRLTAVLADLSPGTDLTPQAQKRQGLKLPGKVKSSAESELEKSKKPNTTPKTGG